MVEEEVKEVQTIALNWINVVGNYPTASKKKEMDITASPWK